MRLAYTDARFAQQGVPMMGVPVVLNDELQIAEGPQRWLFYIALDRGRTRSPATWRSYAEALFDWLQTCQANGWEWDDVEEGHLRAYRNQMLYHPSSVTGREYSTRTINGRLRRLAMFYNWAFRRGLVATVPFEYETVRAPISADVQLLAHLHPGSSVPALDLTVREYRSIPTALSVEDLRRVRSNLGPRDALIADWAVSTGARRPVQRRSRRARPGELCPEWLWPLTDPGLVIPNDARYLARILQLQRHLRQARHEMRADRFNLVYLPLLEIIDDEILPRFSELQVVHDAAAQVGTLTPLPDLVTA